MVFQNIEIFQGLFSLAFGYDLFMYSPFTSVLLTRGTGRKVETCIVIGYRFLSILKLTHVIMLLCYHVICLFIIFNPVIDFCI